MKIAANRPRNCLLPPSRTICLTIRPRADDVIEEIWEIRRQIWARFDNDPKRLLEYYRELEKQYTGPKIEPPAHHNRTPKA